MKVTADVAAVFRARIQEYFSAARARFPQKGNFIGEAELYCESRDCPVRTVRLWVKEYYDEEQTGSDLTCPACKVQLKPHHVRTIAEVDAHNKWLGSLPRLMVVDVGEVPRDPQRDGEPNAFRLLANVTKEETWSQADAESVVMAFAEWLTLRDLPVLIAGGYTIDGMDLKRDGGVSAYVSPREGS